MTIFSIPISLWFVFLAALVAIAALITYALGVRKAEFQAGPLGLILLSIVTGLLIIALFSGVGRKFSGERLISGSLFLKDFKSSIESQCQDGTCQNCFGPSALSRDWNEKECQALQSILKSLDKIESNNTALNHVFKEFSFLRKEMIRKIEILFEALKSQGQENTLELLQGEIARLIVFDELIFNQVQAYLCETK